MVNDDSQPQMLLQPIFDIHHRGLTTQSHQDMLIRPNQETTAPAELDIIFKKSTMLRLNKIKISVRSEQLQSQLRPHCRLLQQFQHLDPFASFANNESEGIVSTEIESRELTSIDFFLGQLRYVRDIQGRDRWCCLCTTECDPSMGQSGTRNKLRNVVRSMWWYFITAINITDVKFELRDFVSKSWQLVEVRLTLSPGTPGSPENLPQ